MRFSCPFDSDSRIRREEVAYDTFLRSNMNNLCINRGMSTHSGRMLQSLSHNWSCSLRSESLQDVVLARPSSRLSRGSNCRSKEVSRDVNEERTPKRKHTVHDGRLCTLVDGGGSSEYRRDDPVCRCIPAITQARISTVNARRARF